jgi:hypothetical protein
LTFSSAVLIGARQFALFHNFGRLIWAFLSGETMRFKFLFFYIYKVTSSLPLRTHTFSFSSLSDPQYATVQVAKRGREEFCFGSQFALIAPAG